MKDTLQTFLHWACEVTGKPPAPPQNLQVSYGLPPQANAVNPNDLFSTFGFTPTELVAFLVAIVSIVGILLILRTNPNRFAGR